MAKKNSEKVKLIALSGLGAVLLLTLVYQLFFTSPPPRPTLQSGKGGAPAKGGTTILTPDNADSAAKRQATSGKANQQEMVRQLLDDMEPLPVRLIVKSGPATVSPRGNIFDYYIEPPKPVPPPPPPPPPPPIALQGVSPTSATAGTPRPFTMTVTASNMPADAQIYMNGSPRPTKRLNDTTLTTEMAPSDYADARNSTIEVKSPSDAKMFSNPLTFTSIALQEPPFKFIGILGEQALIEIIGAKEYLRLKVGDTVQRVWRVDAISNQGLNLTHTQFDIKKRVPLQEKGK